MYDLRADETRKNFVEFCKRFRAEEIENAMLKQTRAANSLWNSAKVLNPKNGISDVRTYQNHKLVVLQKT